MVRAAPPAAPLSMLREAEFAYLDEQGLCYLDYTGAALPARSQLEAQHALVRSTVFGNPHSLHSASRFSTDAIEEARAGVLRFLDADATEYAVCFTANASAAVKLVAESFPFERGSQLVISQDNHNSVNGIREYAGRSGARLRAIPLDAEMRLRQPRTVLAAGRAAAPSLLAFPAQSNFSGVRHPLGLVADARRLGFRVLLDAAAYLPSNAFSLRLVQPDFLVMSMYKLFGFPAGVGALVARREALGELRRPWFAGGTVDWVSTLHPLHRLRSGVEGFEDGTPNFSGIAALRSGFEFLSTVGMPAIGDHVSQLTGAALCLLKGRLHANGLPVFRIHGPETTLQRGGTIAFSVLNASGAIVDYERIEDWAAKQGVAIRGGCFCNPGASEAAFGFNRAQLRRCLDASRAGVFSPQRLGACLGADVPVGALRISVGPATTTADLERAVDVIAAPVLEDRGRG